MLLLAYLILYTVTAGDSCPWCCWWDCWWSSWDAAGVDSDCRRYGRIFRHRHSSRWQLVQGNRTSKNFIFMLCIRLFTTQIANRI